MEFSDIKLLKHRWVREQQSQKLQVQRITGRREGDECPINNGLYQHCRTVSLADRNVYASRINLPALCTSVNLYSCENWWQTDVATECQNQQNFKYSPILMYPHCWETSLRASSSDRGICLCQIERRLKEKRWYSWPLYLCIWGQQSFIPYIIDYKARVINSIKRHTR